MTNEEIRIKQKAERYKFVNRTMRSLPIEQRKSFCANGKCGDCVDCCGHHYGAITREEWSEWLNNNPEFT